MAGRVCLCRIAGIMAGVMPCGRGRSVALRWVSHEELYHLTIELTVIIKTARRILNNNIFVTKKCFFFYISNGLF